MRNGREHAASTTASVAGRVDRRRTAEQVCGFRFFRNFGAFSCSLRIDSRLSRYTINQLMPALERAGIGADDIAQMAAGPRHLAILTNVSTGNLC